MKIKTEFPKFWPILWLCTIALVVMGAALSPSNLDPTQFINNGPVNGQPLMSIRDGAVGTNLTINNITNVNIYSSNGFFTNITVNEFRGRTTITTNLFTTNAFITYLTNITAYVTNLFAVTQYVTNLNVTYVTNDTSYITNLFVSFITNNTSYTTNVFATTVNATTNFNTFNFSTNLFSTNIITTNLFSTFITNQTIYTTNLFSTTVNTTTNISNFNFSTNLVTSNAFFTNIFVMEASWFTNRWVGPTNDVSFASTYQNFVASTDMEITGFQNSIATNANTSVLLLDPGGATRTLYFPATWTNFTSDGNNAYVIPKTNTAIVTLFQYGNLYTNLVVRLFGPGTGTPAPVAQVWSNYLGFIFPSGEPAPDPSQVLPGPSMFVRKDGYLFIGTNVTTQLDPNDANNGPFNAVLYSASNQPSVMQFESSIFDSANQNWYTRLIGSLIADKDNPTLSWVGKASITNENFREDSFGFLLKPNGSSGGTQMSLATNSVAVFHVDKDGVVTANAFTDKSFAANGVVTNDSTGLLHTTPVLPSTLLPTDLAYTDKNNAFTTASSNYVAMTVTTSTNLVWGPDFSVPESLISTNAAFTMVSCVGVDTTKKEVQWTAVNVTNITAAAVAITGPPNVHMVGTWYVTNWTTIWFQCYANAITNGYAIPVF